MFSIKQLLALILVAVSLLAAIPASAETPSAPPNSPSEAAPPNNKAGINVIRWFDTRYVKAVSRIVNSTGGDWGYILVMLTDEDWNNPAPIQKFLDDANTYHLIPILRLATHQEGYWVKPGPDQALKWRNFLTSLKWYTPATYLIVGNEPNLGLEWAGTPNPVEYARYLKSFLDTFEGLRDRFKILNAPMDLSNITQPGMMDDFEFLAAMRAEVPDIFTRLDGWATNPYQFFEGRGIRYTYRGYDQEMDFIGIDLPIFITESYIAFVDDREKIAEYYETAFNYWINDKRVVAVTPHFYNPEAKIFWMFDADDAGNPINMSPSARRIANIPKVMGTPNYVTNLGSAAKSITVSAVLPETPDYPIANGHFYTQTNGRSSANSPYGYSITDEGGIPFWSEFRRLGGVDVLGYPVSRRFIYDGFVSQATQKYLLQWRPEAGQAWFVNVFDVLHQKGKDGWLLSNRQTPPDPGSAADVGLTWDAIKERHWKILDGDPDIKGYFLGNRDPLSHYGLPLALSDMGNSIVLRAQRAVLQKWKVAVPWAPAGYITVANGGDLAKEAGVVPIDATVLEFRAPPLQATP